MQEEVARETHQHNKETMCGRAGQRTDATIESKIKTVI